MCRPVIKFSQAVYIIDPGFHLALAGYQPAWATWYIVLIPQAPGIYARALGPAALRLVRIYQAKHSSLWYKYNIIFYFSVLILKWILSSNTNKYRIDNPTSKCVPI